MIKSESAIKQTKGGRDLYDVPLIYPSHVITACHALRPLSNIIICVCHDNRNACGARTHMHFAKLLLIHTEHAQRICCAKIILCHKRQICKVVKRTDVFGINSGGIHLIAIMDIIIIRQPNNLFKANQLQGMQFFAGHRFIFFIPHSHRFH